MPYNSEKARLKIVAKKKKSNSPSQPGPRPGKSQAAQRAEAQATAALADAAHKADVAAAGDDIKFTDLFKHPMLILAWASLLVTVFALWAAIRYRHELSLGELSEPTHLIVWAAITFTLFASYWRKQRRESKSDS